MEPYYGPEKKIHQKAAFFGLKKNRQIDVTIPGKESLSFYEGLVRGACFALQKPKLLGLALIYTGSGIYVITRGAASTAQHHTLTTSLSLNIIAILKRKLTLESVEKVVSQTECPKLFQPGLNYHKVGGQNRPKIGLRSYLMTP